MNGSGPLQGKAGDSMAINNDDNNDGAGSPLFTFVNENIFKKETFLGECTAVTKAPTLFDFERRHRTPLMAALEMSGWASEHEHLEIK